MIAFAFVQRDGTRLPVEASDGDRLLDVAQRAGQPLEGTCGGAMACATCHVILDPASFGAMLPAGAEEEGMLDFVASATRYSRLSCQIVVSPALAGGTVTIPPG